jgi:predicted GIY-YIG superfamily endonuclease
MMTQTLLFPDPRPLVERLGPDFFRQAPECPGVYLMRDAADTVLYIGKAKNLRKRLANYRVANPDRLRRRHLRLLRAVARIELQECASEASAIAREAALLRSLRPRFNRVGTWPGPLRFLVWRLGQAGLELAVTDTAETEWHNQGPLGAGALSLHAVLVRLLWCCLHPARGLAGMPQGWFSARHGRLVTIPRPPTAAIDEAEARLADFFAGQVESFIEWIGQQTSMQNHPFEAAIRQADLEALSDFKLS